MLMLSLLLQLSRYSKKKYSWIATGFIFAYLMSLRIIGIVAVAAFVLAELNKYIRRKDEQYRLIPAALTVVSTLFIFFAINTWIFSIGTYNLFGFYFDAYKTHSVHSGINFDYYYDV